MDEETKKEQKRKNYLPSGASLIADITYIDRAGHMQEDTSVYDAPKEKIDPKPPHTPSL